MREHIDLIREWRAMEPGAEAILATVVATRGSVYRKPGARMLITRQGWRAGSVSGGCVESDLLQAAWNLTKNGPALETYDALSPDDAVLGFGLGCNGLAVVLVERLPTDGGALAVIERVVRDRRPAQLITAISPGEFLGQRWEAEAKLPRGVEFLRESIEPPPALTIFGAGNDAIPLANLAKGLGWHLTVVDPRTSYASSERFAGADRIVVQNSSLFIEAAPLEAGSAAVVMTHSYLQDLEILRRLCGAHAGYLGVLGPRQRTERLLAEAGCTGDGLYAPIGLDIGAQGPDEIALAIVAEILAVLKGAAGGHLGSPVRTLEGAHS